MGKVKVRYYAIIKGRGYWQPTRKMRLFGFQTDSLRTRRSRSMGNC